MSKPTPIPLTACQSSTVVGHGYDVATKTLAVKFKSGGLYHYAGVPQDVADAMAKSESVGSFVAKSVRHLFDSVKQAETAEAV